MNYYINIETSTDICSVSLSGDNELIDFRENKTRDHAKSVALYIQELLNAHNLQAKELAAVAISKGPGSYTGLRIGTSTAKGIAYQSGIKLIAVDTLQAMALKASENISDDNSVIVSTIDAGRNEVYSELFDMKNQPIRGCEAEIIDENSYSEILKEKKIYFVGNATEKIAKIIKNENAVFMHEIVPSSKYMSKLTNYAFGNQKFEDVAYFDPFYLKDFIAVVSKKNVLKQ